MKYQTTPQSNKCDDKKHASRNDIIGFYILISAVFVFLLAPLNNFFDVYGIGFNLLMLLLSFILLVASLYVAYKSNIDSLAENFLSKIVAILLLFLLTSLSGIVADNYIMSRTLLSPESLPRAQIFVSIYISCLIISMLISVVGIIVWLVSLVFYFSKDVTEIKKGGLELIKKNLQFYPSAIKNFRLNKINRENLSKAWGVAYLDIVKNWHIAPLMGIALMATIFTGILSKYSTIIIDNSIVQSSFVRNDHFHGDLPKTTRITACYNKKPDVYVRFPKEGSSVFAEWSEDPYRIKFYYGVCMRGAPVVSP